jgi:hypothetical protein
MLEDLENEVKMNYERYRSMKASPLTFGQLFQFEHFKTKKYLTFNINDNFSLFQDSFGY